MPIVDGGLEKLFNILMDVCRNETNGIDTMFYM